MDLSYLLFLQGDHGTRTDEGDDDAVTERNPEPRPPEPKSPMHPLKPDPATPDANPIDPRVGQPW